MSIAKQHELSMLSSSSQSPPPRPSLRRHYILPSPQVVTTTRALPTYVGTAPFHFSLLAHRSPTCCFPACRHSHHSPPTPPTPSTHTSSRQSPCHSTDSSCLLARPQSYQSRLSWVQGRLRLVSDCLPVGRRGFRALRLSARRLRRLRLRLGRRRRGGLLRRR